MSAATRINQIIAVSSDIFEQTPLKKLEPHCIRPVPQRKFITINRVSGIDLIYSKTYKAPQKIFEDMISTLPGKVRGCFF
jgi:hypothetical protein